MILSDVCVRRPVLAVVINLLLVAFGLLAFRGLPLRELPDITSPVVSVQTSYPGASAQIIETKITQLIEDQISGIEGIRSITSQSSDGQSQISIEFLVGRDIDGAANDVRDRVSRVLRNLPEDADPPQVSKVDAGADVILWLSMSSTTMSRLQLTDYADRYVVDRLSVLPGVANVRLSGGQRYSMRVWLDRQALAARNLAVDDVERALRSENVELPAGRLESQDREFSVRVGRLYNTPEDFANLVVSRGDGGYMVRLGDIARVEIGPEDDRTDYRGNGELQVGLGIIAQSTANTLAVARSVKEQIQEINDSLPEGTAIAVFYDRTLFVESAVHEVYLTLFHSIAFVIFVIYLFLGSFRAVLIPSVTVPVSLIGSFIALNIFGFSLNLLTLLALVLAIGLVVDDAIVVLENVYRRIELGEPPLLASHRGARQVAFAVIATTAVLVAVFVPLSFLGGNIGRLFREFALAMAASVAFSGVVALTLSPAMCSKLLLPAGVKKSWMNEHVDRIFARIEHAYVRWLDRFLDHPGIVGIALVSTIACSMLFFGGIPKELAPNEDRGNFNVMANMPEGTSFGNAVREMRGVEGELLALVKSGEARRVIARVPASFQSSAVIDGGRATVMLEDWKSRKRSTTQIIEDLRKKLEKYPGVRAVATQQQALVGGSQQPVQIVLGGPNFDELAKWRDTIIEKASQYPGLNAIDSDYKETKPQVVIEIDRTRAADLGVSVETIGRALETFQGGRRVTTYIQNGEEYYVMLEGEESGGEKPDDLDSIYVRSTRTNQLIPLSNLIQFHERADSGTLNRYNRFRAITISANLSPGTTLGEALDYLENLVRTELPSTATLSYKGQSREFRDSQGGLAFVFLLALLIVFLVLAGQFESFVHPLIIMVTVPLAVAGALAGLWAMGSTLNVYSQIGIVMLVGLAAKNGILIVEFANQLRDQGLDFRKALLKACETRLRPICMTALATAAGAVPLVMAHGAGAESRRSIGVVVVFGIIFATALTIFVIPVIYHLVGAWSRSPEALHREIAELDGAIAMQE